MTKYLLSCFAAMLLYSGAYAADIAIIHADRWSSMHEEPKILEKKPLNRPL